MQHNRCKSGDTSHALNSQSDTVLVETISPPVVSISEHRSESVTVATDPPLRISAPEIRTSLKASTIDGIFAAVFSSITSGVLLTNFLLQLGANPVEIGMLSSIPMVVNLLQPLGAYFADRTNSRHNYCLAIFGVSRLLWLILVVGIGWVSWSGSQPHQLVSWTLAMVLVTHILNALGGSSWVSWMAALVPHRLRGRYFGFRNSASSLTTLLSVPIFGFAVSAWPSGTVQGYGVVLVLGIIAGIISMGCQFFMTDVNPLQPRDAGVKSKLKAPVILDIATEDSPSKQSIFQDANFLRFLLYFGVWTFAVNLSAPFFNLYLLDNLHLNLSWVTIYTSLTAGANLVMLVLWGKLADRIGNRPLLIFVGVLAAIVPVFWLGTSSDSLSRWLWLPLIHVFSGGTWAAIDLCSNNIQMEVAPLEHPSKYFAVAAAISGVCGAIGTTTGGFLAQLSSIGGLPGLFALSVIVRLLALLPLFSVQEPRSQPLAKVLQNFLPSNPTPAPVAVTEIGDQSE